MWYWIAPHKQQANGTEGFCVKELSRKGIRVVAVCDSTQEAQEFKAALQLRLTVEQARVVIRAANRAAQLVMPV